VSAIVNLSANVRRLRIARGLTQEQLAERAGTGYKHLQRLEGGIAKGLHFRTLDKFAKALKVEAWELLCPLSEQNPTPAKLASGKTQKKR
jgi:transcriptional regulator with XRE-family HTH domain